MMHNQVFLLLGMVIPMVLGTFPGKSKLSDLRCDEREIDLRLKELNKPAIKSIHSPDGDIIDCVWIYNQPAFDHPLFKNHTIQMRPKSMSIMDNKTGGNKTKIIHQMWRTKGECPENTIPIRRTTRDYLLRSDSIETYGRKKSPPPTIYDQPDAAQDGRVHEHSCVDVDNGQFHGSKSRISKWKPNVVGPMEFSLAQTWVVNGDYYIGLNSLESGWQILPGLYGDNNPRLFAFWTGDTYQNGCYNLDCPGFVQVSRDMSLGATLGPFSTVNGDQYDFLLTIEKEQETGLWWLTFEEEVIGYWPSIIVPKLAVSASKISWGGEIVYYPSGPDWTHTRTQMGSGQFAERGVGEAAYFNSLEYFDTSNHPITPSLDNLVAFETRPECYNLMVGSNSWWGTHFFYGGPGRNPLCP